MGKMSDAQETLDLAESLSLDYVFPYRQETEQVLSQAIKIDPENVTAYYLLGNLLYDHRPADAIDAWEKAAEMDNSIPMVWRNLAFGAFYFERDNNKAINYITKAIQEDQDIPLWYNELSKYYDGSDADFKECLAILRANIDIVRKDVSAPKTFVKLLNLNGEYDEAIDLLGSHHFRTWEGGRSIYWHYVDAHTLKAMELSKEKKYKKAINLLESALLYPENLEVGKSSDDEKNALIYFYMGMVHEKMGKDQMAESFYQKSVRATNNRRMYDLLYFQARSYEKLGSSDEAKEVV